VTANSSKRQMSTTGEVVANTGNRTVRAAKGQPNRMTRRLMQRKRVQYFNRIRLRTFVGLLGAGSFVGVAITAPVASATSLGKSIEPPPSSVSGTLTGPVGRMPLTVTDTLPGVQAWVQHELKNSTLTAAEKSWIENDLPTDVVITASTEDGASGDPIATGGCIAKSIVGVKDWSFTVYQGFSDSGPPLYKNVTNVAPPHYSWTTLPVVWSYQGGQQLYEYPQPPAATVQTENQGKFSTVNPFGVGLTDLCDVTFTMHANGSWSAAYKIDQS